MMPSEIAELLLGLEKQHGAVIVREGCRKYMLRRTYAGELPEKRKKIPMSRKVRLYAVQDGKCAMCRDPYAMRDLEIDEYIPASRGGLRKPGNMQLLCPPCNKAKANHTPSEEAKCTGVTIIEQLTRLPRFTEEGEQFRAEMRKELIPRPDLTLPDLPD